ncbi:unnamed protein product [Closterium sp. Naga37s-1]|nr:unnamed protein product [Closterium sp. Naga37s-1]
MATRGGRGRGLGLRIGVPSRTANAARPQPLPLPVPQALPMPPAGAAAAAAAAAKGAPTSVQPLPVAAINGGAGSGAGGASGTGSGAAGGTALGVAGAGNAVKAPMMVFTPREDVALEDLERILPPLGFGSGGRVYRVRHKKTGKEYALKVIQEKYDEEVRKQIIQEMQILRRARSDHVSRSFIGAWGGEGGVGGGGEVMAIS